MTVKYSNIKRKFCLLMIAILLVFSFDILTANYTAYAEPSSDSLSNEQVKEEIERIYNARSACLVSGDYKPLKELFDTSQKTGRWALEHEVKRVKYLSAWADERNITFRNIQSWVRVKKVYPKGNILKVALEESYKFDYVYGEDKTYRKHNKERR